MSETSTKNGKKLCFLWIEFDLLQWHSVFFCWVRHKIKTYSDCFLFPDDAPTPNGSLVSEEEMTFYKKLFPNFDIVTKRRIHCTVCRTHLGCAPGKADEIKMHPVLRVMQCSDCHEFYSSGEFSRGDDGSELFCRWCGQGGVVYCCSSCPYVFCKGCIVENLNKGVVRDIEENESWNCFNCSTKIIWPIRAMYWALSNYMAKEKEWVLYLLFIVLIFEINTLRKLEPN